MENNTLVIDYGYNFIEKENLYPNNDPDILSFLNYLIDYNWSIRKIQICIDECVWEWEK